MVVPTATLRCTQHLLHGGAEHIPVGCRRAGYDRLHAAQAHGSQRLNTCQRPSGVASLARPAARPHNRVICVVTPLSSRNFSFSGGNVATVARNSSRRLRLASVSRSRAWSDFFQPQAHLMKDLADAAAAHRYSLGLQLFAQLGQLTVRLLPYPITHLVAESCRHRLPSRIDDGLPVLSCNRCRTGPAFGRSRRNLHLLRRGHFRPIDAQPPLAPNLVPNLPGKVHRGTCESKLFKPAARGQATS